VHRSRTFYRLISQPIMGGNILFSTCIFTVEENLYLSCFDVPKKVAANKNEALSLCLSVVMLSLCSCWCLFASLCCCFGLFVVVLCFFVVFLSPSACSVMHPCSRLHNIFRNDNRLVNWVKMQEVIHCLLLRILFWCSTQREVDASLHTHSGAATLPELFWH